MAEDTDLQRFYRLVLSNHDWLKCRKTLNTCATAKNETAKEALLLMAIVYYARPFSGNERNPGATAASRVDPTVLGVLTAEELKLHARLMELRHKAVAHAESETYHAIGLEPNGILASAVFSPWNYINDAELPAINALAEKLWSKGDILAWELRRTLERRSTP